MNQPVPHSRRGLDSRGRFIKRENSPEPVVEQVDVSNSTVKVEEDDSDVEFTGVSSSTAASSISSKRRTTAGSSTSLKRRREPVLPSSIGASFDSVEQFRASLGTWYNDNFASFPGLKYASESEHGTCKTVTATCERKRDCSFMVRMEPMLHGLGYQVTKSCTLHSKHCTKQAELNTAITANQFPSGTGPPIIGTSYRSFEIFRAMVKEWHAEQYPDRSIVVRRAVWGLGGRPAATCSKREKGRIVCGFTVVARSLGEGRYTVIQADTAHSSACNEAVKNSRSSRPSAAEAPSRARTKHRDHIDHAGQSSQARGIASSSDSSDEEPLSHKSKLAMSPSSRPQSNKPTAANTKDKEAAAKGPDVAEVASGSGSRVIQPQPHPQARPPPESKWVEVQEPLRTIAPYMRTRFALHGITTTEHLLDAGIETCEQFAEAVRQVCKLEPHTQGSMAEIATFFTLRAYL